jgi:hypothetical protein
MEKTQKYFEFDQNNTGGDFVIDEKLSHRLYIEAEKEEKAIEIAVNLGVYFDGVADGRDCGCCGDRWYSPSEMVFPYVYGTFKKEEAKEIASKYNGEAKESEKGYGDSRFDVHFKDVEQYAQYLADKYGNGDPDSRIYYKNGRVVAVSSKQP